MSEGPAPPSGPPLSGPDTFDPDHGFARVWVAFRSLPTWVQVIAWIVGFPVLGPMAIMAGHRGGSARPMLAGGLLLIAAPLWLAMAVAPVVPPDLTIADQPAEAGAEATDLATDAATTSPSPPADPTDDSTTATPTPDPTATTTTDPGGSTNGTTGGTPTTSPVAGELRVHYLDVGQGDATLLQHPDATILIDAGRHDRSDVLPHLRNLGVTSLDLVVITHPHADHIGQFDRVLDAFDVEEVWWSGSTHTTQTFQRAVAALEASNADYEEPRAGDATSIGPLLIEVVNPPVGTNLSNLHDANLALRVTYGDVRFLFTGDAETATESRMVSRSRATLSADILQLGHHGSRTSTTSTFLAAVDPAVAIWSASATNQYGHPHAEVIDRVTAAGIEVFGTASHGTVTVTTDGRTWRIGTSRTGPPASGGSTGGQASPTPSPSPSPSPTPSPSPSPSPTPPPSASGCQPSQVDINTAGFEELQEIIHIGPDRAQQILELRPFSSVNDMERISGIGPARLQDIKDQGLACAG